MERLNARQEGAAEIADADPVDEDFTDLALRALDAFVARGGVMTREDRRETARTEHIPSYVFGRLGALGAIVRGSGDPPDVRRLTDEGRAWAVARSLPESRGNRAEQLNAIMGRYARSRGLSTRGDAAHILLKKSDWRQNLWPPLQDADVFPSDPDRDLHRWVHHLRSSQAFAFNVFGPLAAAVSSNGQAQGWAIGFWDRWFPSPQRVEFEFPNTGDPLGELAPDRPHRTRVDVRIDYGEAKTALIEVKFTEEEFGTCSAGRNADNPRAATCSGAQSIADLAAGCYLATDLRRPYFSRLAETILSPELFGLPGCPFRSGLYQLMRNALMVEHVRVSERRDVELVVFAPGPRLNPALHASVGAGSVDDYLRTIVRDTERHRARAITFEDVLAHGPVDQDWAEFMTEKYLRPLELVAVA